MEIPVFFLFFVLLLLHYFSASFTLTIKTSITTDQLALLALKSHITDDLTKPWQAIGLPLPPIATGLGSLAGQTPLSHYLEPFSHGSYRNYCSTSGKPIIPPSFILQKQQFQGSLPNELAYLG
ncbi:hypothetical protein CFP56_015708 [Quercus suber]|uniref:Uncharacterized protein n=1 Tax=Quercus suber TaxID=58331 RepID=A0AAW0KR89_QUESU